MAARELLSAEVRHLAIDMDFGSQNASGTGSRFCSVAHPEGGDGTTTSYVTDS